MFGNRDISAVTTEAFLVCVCVGRGRRGGFLFEVFLFFDPMGFSRNWKEGHSLPRTSVQSCPLSFKAFTAYCYGEQVGV